MRAAPGRIHDSVEPGRRIGVVHRTGAARRRCCSADACQRIGTARLSADLRIQGRAAHRGRFAPHSHTAECLIMFTGIILATGRVISRVEGGGDLELGIDAAALDLDRIAVGDSVSVQGAWLTVTRKDGTRFYADVSRETMAKTTLGASTPVSRVNLQPRLRAVDALTGQWVSGPVDAVGKLKALVQDARSWRLEFELPPSLMRFVAPKGSICVNGVSLTVNKVEGRCFDVIIIPHTFELTTLGELEIDDGVNIEVDVIARNLERLMPPSARN